MQTSNVSAKGHQRTLHVRCSTLMPNNSSLRVSNPPPKPLLIWDGECDFCRLWIERWREITAGKVDYATYQEAAKRFSEIPVDQFMRAMAFIPPRTAPSRAITVSA